MIKSLEELSRILAVAGISSSQEEQILTAVKNLSTSLKFIKELEFHEEPKASTDHLFQSMEEIEDSCTTYDGERPLEPEIEELLPCLSTNPICINHSDLCGITKEDGQHCLNEEVHQEHYSYIECWFTIIFEPHHYFLLHLLVSNHLQLLVFHALMNIKAYMLNLGMNVFVYLLCIWLHWKYSYT
jgi:hypothetical protein